MLTQTLYIRSEGRHCLQCVYDIRSTHVQRPTDYRVSSVRTMDPTIRGDLSRPKDHGGWLDEQTKFNTDDVDIAHSPIVEMNVVVNASSENLNRMHVLPTPESPISNNLNSRSYVFLAITDCRVSRSPGKV